MANPIKINVASKYPRILVIGSAGGLNQGDNDILEQNMKMLLARLPDVTFCVPSSCPRRLSDILGHLPIEPVKTGRLRFETPEVRLLSAKCDAVITSAGIFFDHSLHKIKNNFVASLGFLLWRLHRNKIPICGFNVGILPPNSSIGQFFIRKALSAHDHIFVRDSTSMKIIKRFGLQKIATLAADSAIVGNSLGSNNVLPMLPWSDLSGGDVWGINITPHLSLDKRRGQTNNLSEWASSWIRAICLRRRVILLATEKKDKKFLEKLADRVNLPDRCAVGPFINAATTRALMKRCSFFIGTRLHSLIFSCSVGTPFAGIPYQTKVSAFLNDSGAPAEMLLNPVKKSPEYFLTEIEKAYNRRLQSKEAIMRYVKSANNRRTLAADWLAEQMRQRRYK